MSREKQIEEAAEKYEHEFHDFYKEGMTVANYCNSEIPGTCFIKGAQWADENPKAAPQEKDWDRLRDEELSKIFTQYHPKRSDIVIAEKYWNDGFDACADKIARPLLAEFNRLKNADDCAWKDHAIKQIEELENKDERIQELEECLTKIRDNDLSRIDCKAFAEMALKGE